MHESADLNMPFSFLNPWFWLGALVVAAPIWLHLRRKRETNLVEFSALRFLDDQPEPRRSPLRLRDIVLFALQMAGAARMNEPASARIRHRSAK